MIRAAVTFAAAAAVALGAPGVALAGVATSDGGGVRFTDPAAADDGLYVTIEDGGAASWLVSFLQYDPPTQAGPGCAEGFVSTECPAGAVPVTVDGGAGDDVLGIEGRGAPPGAVTLRGGDGDDSLSTIALAALLDGGAGDDTLLPDERVALAAPPPPTPGSVVRGGPGTDTVSYGTALDPIVVTLDGRADDGRPGEGDEVQPDVENVTAGDLGAVVAGSAAANRLLGGGGADRLAGRAGRDRLVGSGGDDDLDALDARGGDTVDCGVGSDTAWVDAGDALVDAAACERAAWAPALASTRLRFRGGRIVVRLACPRIAARCRGAVSAPGTDGGARYDMKSGRTARARLRPTRATRAALRAGRVVRSRLVIGPRGANGTAPTGRAVSIRP